MKLIICFAAIFVSVSPIRARDPDWFSHRSGDLNNALKIESINERIDALSKFMTLASYGGMDEEQKIIFSRAQAALLSIPGHAKYFQDKIEEMRAAVLADSKMPPEEISKMQNDGKKIHWEAEYLSYGTAAIRTLRYMPSAETVSVLGHFLNDPEGRDGKTLLGNDVVHPGDDFQRRPSHAEEATDSIRNLGIEHPPFKNISGKITDEEVDAWKDWWNQVKEGKRTYRFVGSKIEYGPDGPASKEVIQHIERDQKRDAEREAGHRKSPRPAAGENVPAETKAGKPGFLAAIAAGCLLIAGAVWYFLRGRRTA